MGNEVEMVEPFNIFRKKTLIRIGNISRKFPNLINLSVISIFISDSNHLIGIQLTFQGDIAQLGIQRIFRRSKFPGTLYFHIILPPSIP